MFWTLADGVAVRRPWWPPPDIPAKRWMRPHASLELGVGWRRSAKNGLMAKAAPCTTALLLQKRQHEVVK
jgi:hypothetical protein